MAIDENPAEFSWMAKQDIELSTATELLCCLAGLVGLDGLFRLNGLFRQLAVYIARLQ